MHGMNVDEAMEKLQKHIINLSGLSSATFVLQVGPNSLAFLPKLAHIQLEHLGILVSHV